MSKIDIHHLTKKQRKQMHGWLRAIIQLLYFLFLPSAYTAAFAGVKYIFTQLGAGEKIGLTSFVSVLIVLCLYTIVFGRFFCGFACAFGSFGDALHGIYLWICKKIRKKPRFDLTCHLFMNIIETMFSDIHEKTIITE